MFEEVGALDFVEEGAEVVDALFDDGGGSVVVGAFEGEGGAGADVHHEELGPELEDGPGHLGGFGVFLDEIEDFEVALGVAEDAGEILELEEADVAVVELDGFLLELGTILGIEMEAVFFAFVLVAVFLEAGLEVFEEGFVAEGGFAIGPAEGVHLEEAEVDAELDFFLSVLPLEPPDDNLPCLVLPGIQHIGDVERHGQIMVQPPEVRQPAERAIWGKGARNGCRRAGFAPIFAGMSSATTVLVHESAAPAAVRGSLLAALRAGELHGKFHYLGLKQTLRWMALHEAYSPARRDPAVIEMYRSAFAAAGEKLAANVLHLIGLAAGSGHKEVAGAQELRRQGKAVIFSPLDASLEIVLSAHQLAIGTAAGLQSHPILCDLPECSSLPALLKQIDPGGTTRLVTFFGAMPNFRPEQVLPVIRHIVRSQDLLLVSANLAPEREYEASFAEILPQYDNATTREWLLGGVEQAGFAAADGRLEFAIAPMPGQETLRRVEARFTFDRPCRVELMGEVVAFQPGESILAFTSCRYTVGAVQEVLRQFGFSVAQSWVSAEESEGVFLCGRI